MEPPGPQLWSGAPRCQASWTSPRKVVPTLSSSDGGVDEGSLSFLLQQTFLARKKEKEKEKEVERQLRRLEELWDKRATVEEVKVVRSKFFGANSKE